MERLYRLIGHEQDIESVSRSLYAYASESGVPAVGALHLTCSDESERECVDAFQHTFAEYLLPNLKFGERSVFRLANLGARYEWGAVHIAEEHYSTSASKNDFKLLVVKVNSHVCVEHKTEGHTFGHMLRYDSESTYCGALHSLMAGGRLPFADDLCEALASGGIDRLSRLLDAVQVPSLDRSLFIAIASARVQARRAIIDIRDRKPDSPTLFLILPCVTLNKKAKDGEILCGLYRADWRSEQPTFDYRGLGDDPAGYRLQRSHGRVTVEDDHLSETRPARDHRKLVFKLWERHGGNKQTRSAILLFAEGIAGIHHLHRAERLATGRADEREARIMIEDIRQGLEQLPDPLKSRAAEIMD
jgi:hypothetical protein